MTWRRLASLQSCRMCGGTISSQSRLPSIRFLSSAAKQLKRPRDLTLPEIRNIGISAHIDSGKTTVTERILYYTGRIGEIHEVRGKDGVGAKMDSMELERQRGITIKSAATFVGWGDHSINIIDTPGHVDFTIEVERSLRVLDGAVLVLCGVSGVQSQTMTVNRQMKRYNVPAIGFINKLDRMAADPDRVNSMLRARLLLNTGYLNYPIGIEKDLCGVVDVIKNYASYFDGENGEFVRKDEVPADLRARVVDMKQELIENVSNVDEELAEMYLLEQIPTDEQLRAAIRRCCLKRTFLPLCCGSALKNVGVQPLLDCVVEYLPDPSEVDNFANDRANPEEKILLAPARSKDNPMVALAFKLDASRFGQLTFFRLYQGMLMKGDTIFNTRTGKKTKVSEIKRMHSNEMESVDIVYSGDIFAILGLDCSSGDTFVSDNKLMDLSMENIFVPKPVVAMSIKPKNQKNVETFSKALTRFQKEDPTFTVKYDQEASETLIEGMGELHLEIYSQRMDREYNCPVILGEPRVQYRETIIEKIKFDYQHKKQTGGHGQFGRISGYFEPLVGEEYLNLEFWDEIRGTTISKNYMTGIERGFRDACEEGSFAGLKIAGVRMVLQDGAEHPVDSGEKAFYNCSFLCFKQFYEMATKHVIEPIMAVEVAVPFEFNVAVQTSIITRGGAVTNVTGTQDTQVIEADVPLSNMFGYISELRSRTEGKGEFTMEYKSYQPASEETESEVIGIFDAGGRVMKKKFHTD